MYEFIILSQLLYGPRHGYLMAKIINDIIGPYARLSPGRLYPLLAKMEQNGLIEANENGAKKQQGDRQSRAYKITKAGRMRFYILMKDTSSSPGEYQKLFGYKVSAFGYITPLERLDLIDHYIHYCQSHVLHQEREAKDLMRNGEKYAPMLSSSNLEFTLEMLHHSIDGWQHELEWARGLRTKEFVTLKPADYQEQESIIEEKNT
jgi:DNA-binding PadR family transcriptional regulator